MLARPLPLLALLEFAVEAKARGSLESRMECMCARRVQVKYDTVATIHIHMRYAKLTILRHRRTYELRVCTCKRPGIHALEKGGLQAAATSRSAYMSMMVTSASTPGSI